MQPQPDLVLRWEDRPWEPQGTRYAESADHRRRLGTPYQAAVPAAIAMMSFRLDPSVEAHARDAQAEITRFDERVSAMFTDGDGEFAPLGSVLLRTESVSSSQIEQITTGARQLALAELGLTKRFSNAKFVVANVDAMQRAIALAEDITPESILSIHEVLMRDQRHADPGNFRTEQVWIGGRDSYPHDADFVPPHHDRIGPALDDLCAYTTRSDIALVAHAAIAHAQFETIHPFSDGNGRTGRALVHAMLKRGGATTRTTVPVSAGLLSDTQTYFDALTAYRNGDPNSIVTRFGDATHAAINNGQHLATDLQGIHEAWKTQLTARSDSVAWRVLPLLLSQPAVTSVYIQQRTDVSQPAADRALRQLRDNGIVASKNEHGEDRKRDVVYRADSVLMALDDFADRARRTAPAQRA